MSFPTLLWFLTLLSLIAYVVYRVYQLRRETFVPSAGVQYMTAQETAAFLVSDPDGYVKNMSPTDLYARKVSSAEKYVHRARDSAMDFTPEQKLRFNEACATADAFFERVGQEIPLSVERLVRIPWVLALTEGEKYEDGLPHTRANIIFVSSYINEQPKELVRTMIHEKIHIYQRLYPEEMSQVLVSIGFQRWKLRMGIPRIRANPDVDPWVYLNRDQSAPMMALYASDQPASISDVFLQDAAFEHPYEYVAYEIASKYQ
jgi:hypothetical protein